MPNPQLPLELIEHIFESITANDDLRNCALACWMFLPICRRLLFASICIAHRPLDQFRSTDNLAALLRKSPEIADYTRKLHIWIQCELEFHPLPAELKILCRLPETFGLHFMSNNEFVEGPDYLDFNLVPQDQQDILFCPMPRLKTLFLDNITNFPLYQLPLFTPKLRRLTFWDIEFNETFMARESLPALKPIALEGFDMRTFVPARSINKLLELQQSNGHRIIDILGLVHLNLLCASDDPEFESEWISIRTKLLQTRQLSTIVFEAEFCIINVMNGLGKLLLPSIQNLTSLEISTWNGEVDQDPLCGLCEELEVLGSHPNVLESLSFRLAIFGCECGTGDEWGKLDQVLHNYAWPMLKKVHIIVWMENETPRTDPGPYHNFRRRLEAIPEQQISRLHARKDIDFTFGVISQKYGF